MRAGIAARSGRVETGVFGTDHRHSGAAKRNPESTTGLSGLQGVASRVDSGFAYQRPGMTVER